MSGDLAANLLLLLLAGLLLWAAIGDIRTFNISNELNLAIALIAPLHWWASGTPLWPAAAAHVGIAILIFVVLTGAWWLGMMGGGDVKMASAVALWLPPAAVPAFVVVMSLAGGVVTLIALIRHRMARREGRPEVPYGVAIAASGLWLIAQRYLNQFN